MNIRIVQILLAQPPNKRIDFLYFLTKELNKKKEVRFQLKLINKIGGYKKCIMSLGSDLKNLGIPRLNVRSLFTFKTFKH